MAENIPWTQAIEEMRKLSHQKKTFSFSHSTYDREENTSRGIVNVDRAILRKGIPVDAFTTYNPDLLLGYENVDTGEKRLCFKILITKFNGKNVILE